MKKNFSTEFLNFIKKIPFIEGVELVSFNFSIVYPKGQHGEPKNILMVRYQKNKMRGMEILIQSPKYEVLKDINLSDFNSIRIGGKSFYTDYDPKIKFFPSPLSYNLYTLVTDNDVITIATDNQKGIKSIKIGHLVKLESKILEYVNKIPDEVEGFEKCFIIFNRKIYKDQLSIMFQNLKQEAEINIDIFEDEKNLVGELINDITIHKKKINNFLTKGEIRGKDSIFCKLNKKGFLIVSCRGGKNDLLTGFTKKIIQIVK